MKKIGILVLIVVLMVGCSQKEEVVNNGEDDVKTALSFVENLSSENFEKAYNEYGYHEKMKEAVSAEVYEEIWTGLIEQQGAYKGQMGYEETDSGDYHIVSVLVKFENGLLNLNVVFDKEHDIAGFNFSPYMGDGEVDEERLPDNVKEAQVTVVTGKYEMEGTLTLPGEGENYPVVLLVPGSGPTDKDETLHENKPFKDIAWGLAERGVASLRYDKRALKYGMEMSQMEFTVKDEYLDDVESAYNMLLANEKIDSEKIYILGHSQGGNMIPRIAEVTNNAAGYIMAAANATNISDLMVRQYKYIFSLDGEIDEKEQEQIDFIEDAVEKIHDADANSNYTSNDLIGAPKSYWIDMRENDSYDLVDNITKPLLVIQGEKDYQVTMPEFELWKEAFEGKENVEFVSYENLNHLFMESEGTPSPEEYKKPQKVSETVIEDIAGFVLEN